MKDLEGRQSYFRTLNFDRSGLILTLRSGTRSIVVMKENPLEYALL